MSARVPPALTVAPCSHEAATYAVMNWHYSRSMPIGKLVKFGAWEDDVFVGAVVFGRGASPALVSRFDLPPEQGCELVRIALDAHCSPVSQIAARSMRQLSMMNPTMRVVVSFADSNEAHHGGIYQAGNWIYTGMTASSKQVFFDGRWQHERNLRATGWGTLPKVARGVDVDSLPERTRLGKHRYVMPLDRAMRRRVAKMALPYPSPAVEGSTASRSDSIGEG